MTEPYSCTMHSVGINKDEEEGFGICARTRIPAMAKAEGTLLFAKCGDVTSPEESQLLLPDLCPMGWKIGVLLDETECTNNIE